MVGPVEVGAAINGLKGALDLVKGVKAVSEGLAVQDVKMDLGQRIIDAQMTLNLAIAAQTEAAQEIRQLKEEIVRLKDWSAEREKYELVAVRGGGFAYMLKAGMRGSQPAHWLCANCFEQGQKSIMQEKGQVKSGSGDNLVGCDRCKGSFTTLSRTRPTYDLT